MSPRLTRSQVIAVIALTLLSACRSKKAHEAPASEPRAANLLLVTLDTTRADHLSCYGLPSTGSGARTPHLDALAEHGVRFAHATAQVPLTLPSHACIMTGAYPEVHGLRDMGGFILNKNHPTIATITQAAGFSTGAFVGSSVLSRRMGLSNGFSTYDDDMAVETADRLPGVYPERRAAAVTDRALAWLKQNGGERFFLWVHFYDPHAPYDPPAPFNHAYARDLYSGEIAYVDEQMGRLLDGLDEASLTARTLVVVIADHGESLGEHGELTHGIFLYDSTTRVPLIVAGPSVPHGKVIDEQVRSIDVMPTVLAALGLAPGSQAQGVDLWPLIENGRQVRSNYSYLETLYPRTYMGWSELRAMRTDQWKLIVAPHPELYNLERDPGETQNLITRNPADADRLQKQVWAIAGVPSQKEKIAASPVDPQTRQELESLGYVSAGTPREIQLGTAAPDPKDEVEVLKLLADAEELLNKSAYAAASDRMERALKIDPANPLCHLYLATAFERARQFERAAGVYQDAIRHGANTDQIYSRLGKDYLRLGQLDRAVDAMMRANQINPTDLDNLRNLGTALLQLHRVEEAEAAFKAITLQNERYSAAWNGMGLVAIQRGDTEAARRDFEKAIEVGPDEAEPLLNLGILYQKTGQKQEAARYLTMFLKKASPDQYGHLFADVREAIRECKAK